MPLTAKQTRFVAEYLVDLNATQAAIRAGYTRKTARQQGSRLLTHVDVKAAIAPKQAAQLEKVNIVLTEHLQQIEVTAERVKTRLGLLAFQDIRTLFDDAGNLIPIKRLSDDAAVMVGGLEVIKKNAAAGDGVIDTIHKVKIIDPVKALEMLAKHFGLLEEKIEHRGEIRISWL